MTIALDTALIIPTLFKVNVRNHIITIKRLEMLKYHRYWLLTNVSNFDATSGCGGGDGSMVEALSRRGGDFCLKLEYQFEQNAKS